MTNIELYAKKEKDFNLFFQTIGLVKNGEVWVKFDSVQPEDDNQLVGELFLKSKKVKAILTKTLAQKPHKTHTPYSKVFSFKIKGKGWIVIEDFEDSSFITLLNKWW